MTGSQAMAADCFSKQICGDAAVANGTERHMKSGTRNVWGKTQDD